MILIHGYQPELNISDDCRLWWIIIIINYSQIDQIMPTFSLIQPCPTSHCYNEWDGEAPKSLLNQGNVNEIYPGIINVDLPAYI